MKYNKYEELPYITRLKIGIHILWICIGILLVNFWARNNIISIVVATVTILVAMHNWYYLRKRQKLIDHVIDNILLEIQQMGTEIDDYFQDTIDLEYYEDEEDYR